MLTKRKQVYLAVAGSVAIHLAVLFAWALTVQWFPAAEAATSQPPDPIKLEVVEEKPEAPPTPEPEPIRQAAIPKSLAFKDMSDVPEASQAPKNAVVESDRNSEAASELPPTGDQPLPTQKGKAVPNFQFDTHPDTPGAEGKLAGENAPENMPPPILDTAPPPPRPQATPLAQTTPPPAPTATPAASVADPRDLAMEVPKSIPAAPTEAEPNPYDPSFRPPAGMTEPPRPTPVPRRGGYRPMQERSGSNGSVAKMGLSSLDGEATPSGRYKAQVVRTIDHRWRQLFDVRSDLMSIGTVRVHFALDRTGKARAFIIISNTANEALASISTRAVAEAPIPPMPEDVAAAINGELMPVDIDFNAEAPPF